MSAVDKTDQGGVRRCQKKGAVINTWNKSILGRNHDAEAGA